MEKEENRLVVVAAAVVEAGKAAVGVVVAQRMLHRTSYEYATVHSLQIAYRP